MLKILFAIFLSIISCQAGFKAAIGLDFKAEEKEIFYDLMNKSSEKSASNYSRSYRGFAYVHKKGKRMTVEKDLIQTFSIFDDRFSSALMPSDQKEIKSYGIEYRVISNKKKQESPQDVFLAQYTSDSNKFREIQPGEIVTISIEVNKKRGSVTKKQITGIYEQENKIEDGKKVIDYFVRDQNSQKKYPIHDQQLIIINGVTYEAYRAKLTSRLATIQQKKYTKEGLLKLSNAQQKELMNKLFILLDGISDEAWVTYNTVQTSLGKNSEKYSKAELLNDIVANLKDNPKKHYAALMKFFEFMNIHQWKHELTSRHLNERLNLIKLLRSVFFIKRANLNDYLNVMMSFYERTLYVKTLPLPDKINLMASESITTIDDFRSFFPLMRGVTILRYEEDARQQQVQAVSELVRYVKRIIEENKRQYGNGKIPAKAIDVHVAAISAEWERLQHDMHEKPVLVENPIEDLIRNVVAHSKHAAKKRQAFNPEEADAADIDTLEEKFEDDDAFQEWKANIESEQRAKKARNNATQEAVVIARVENDEAVLADDIEAIVGTVKSPKVKQKLSELAEKRREEQEERETEEAKKRTKKAVAQKVEAAVAAAVQDDTVPVADLEAIASKATSPKAKAQIEEAIAARTEENDVSKTKRKPIKAKKPHLYDRDETDYDENHDSDEDVTEHKLKQKKKTVNPSHNESSDQEGFERIKGKTIYKPRSEMTAEERTIDNREKRKRQKENKRNRESLIQTTNGD